MAKIRPKPKPKPEPKPKPKPEPKPKPKAKREDGGLKNAWSRNDWLLLENALEEFSVKM